MGVVVKEAREFLSELQFDYAVDLIEQLAETEDPTSSLIADVRRLDEEILELRDQQGVLRTVRLRMFFAVDRTSRIIIILMACEMPEDDPVPAWLMQWLKIRLAIARSALRRK